MADDSHLSIAVIGLGSIGLRHARNLIALGADVCGYDPDMLRAQQLIEAGGRYVDSGAEALKRSSAVVIASPPAQHARDMKAAVEAGRHVFVEKPMSTATNGLSTLLDQANDKGLVVYVGLNLRLHPAVMAARARLKGGAIERTLWARMIMSSYLPDWRSHQDYRRGYAADPASGGIILDLIHEIDLARHMMGSLGLVSAAAARTGALDADFADLADIVLRRADGAQVNIHLDYVTRPRRRRVEFGGEAGVIEIDLDGRQLRRWSADGTCVEDVKFDGSYADDYVSEARSFLDCIEGRATPPCVAEEALEVLSLALQARNAAERVPA